MNAHAPIRVKFLPQLTASRGRLFSATGPGAEVHAASFLRLRQMVLDEALLHQPDELARIVVHELFHFGWVRLGNEKRAEWEHLLGAEKSRGELGWSAERLKRALSKKDRERRSTRWREYLCESFSDTGAWMYAGGADHDEYTLASRFRAARARWFRSLWEGRGLVL